jgi:hypothetical protein
MLEWFLQAVYDGDEELVYFIAEKIDFEYETLCDIIETKKQETLSAVELCCSEITRLERENKKLKSELERRT